MKPITLKIAGLHSFREPQTIDFTKVTDAGLFGIFGPTGSGKSTILDAMTLALYGRVERSGGNRHGILNQHEPQLHVSLTFEIASHNARNTYQVERTYKRKDAHSVQSTHARLIACQADGDVVLEDKDTAVTEEIRSLLGLNVDDFTRAVVLPQGKFEEFLKLKGKERRDMLERIFCLDTYGEWLKQRATIHLQDLTQHVDRISSQQEMLGEATSEAVEAAEQLYKEAVQARLLLEKEKATFDREYDNWQKVREYQQELEEINSQLAELERERTTIEDIEHALQKADRANQVYPLIQSYREWEEQAARTVAELKQTETTAAELTHKREKAQAAYEQAESEWEEKSPWLTEQKVRAHNAIEWEQTHDRLVKDKENTAKALASLEQRRTAYEREIETHNGQIRQLNAEIERIQQRLASIRVTTKERRQLREAETALNELSVKQQQLERAVKRYDEKREQLNKETDRWERAKRQAQEKKEELERLQQECQATAENPPVDETLLQAQETELRDRAKQIETVRSLQSELRETEDDVQKLDSEISDIEAQLKRCTSDAEETRNDLSAKQAERTILEERISEQNTRQLAAQLVSDLTEGEPCPVCGSIHHPAPADGSSEDASTELTQALQRVNEEMAETEKRLYQLEKDVSVLNTQLDHKKEWREKAQALGDVKKTQLDELLQSLPQVYSDTDTDWMHAILAKERERFERDREAFAAWKSKLNQLQADVDLYQSTYYDLWQQTVKADSVRLSVFNAVEEAGETVSELRIQVQTAQCAWEAVKGSWTADKLTERVAEMNDWDKEREQLEQKRDQLGSERDERQQQLNRVQNELNGLTSEIQSVTSEKQRLEQQSNDLSEKINAVTKGKTAQQFLQETEETKARMKQQLGEAKSLYQQVDKSWQEAQRQLTALTASKRDQERQLATAEERLNKKLEEHRFVTAREAEEARLTDAEWQHMRERVDHYKETRKQLERDRERLVQQLDGRVLSEDEWSEMASRKQTMEQHMEKARENVIYCENAYKSKVRDHERWQSLERERKEKQRELDHASELHHVLRGNAFVEFIAREHLIHIAADASKHLGELTRYRYGLEIDRDGGFVMRDDANGGLRRPVSTLSGGETFLTSLSLALALSSQIQLKGECPLEFFFLDEGFGTLDAELLDVVISSLEKLHFKHMTIGLISHVPELQNRLHRKIVVTPATAGEGTKVHVAYA